MGQQDGLAVTTKIPGLHCGLPLSIKNKKASRAHKKISMRGDVYINELDSISV